MQKNEEVKKELKEIIPKKGVLCSEQQQFIEIMCKPKILPLKSLTLLKLEQMEKELSHPKP